MSPAHRVIVAGGGPAAAEAMLALREALGNDVQLELIAPESELVVHAYDVLAPFHEGRDRRYPWRLIADSLGATVSRDALVRVDAEARSAILSSGAERPYDSLIVAVGARRLHSVEGAAPFRGAEDAATLKALLTQSRSGRHQSVAFVAPPDCSWPLPLYELALQTSQWLAERSIGGMPLTLVSAEPQPLSAFGPAVSAEVAALLAAHGVAFVRGHAVRLHEGRLMLAGGDELEVDHAVALPRLAGPRVAGLPFDADGFVPVDDAGRVRSVAGVYAAGDATTFPIKQGGLATQQADRVAGAIAAEVGGREVAEPSPPVLRAILYAGREKRYLHAELGDGLEDSSRASRSPLWEGSSKVVGQYLGAFLEGLDAPALNPY